MNTFAPKLLSYDGEETEKGKNEDDVAKDNEDKLEDQVEPAPSEENDEKNRSP